MYATYFSAGRFVYCVCCVLWFFPFHVAEDVLKHFHDRFIEKMDASTVVQELVYKGVIDDGNETQIRNESSRRVKNQILHACLNQKCTWVAFNEFCDIIIKVPGNPAMNALGHDMQRKLQTGKCCAFVCMGT